MSKPELNSKMIYSMEDRLVKFIYEDPDPKSEGFYMVSSQRYDDHITISHTHQSNDKFQ